MKTCILLLVLLDFWLSMPTMAMLLAWLVLFNSQCFVSSQYVDILCWILPLGLGNLVLKFGNYLVLEIVWKVIGKCCACVWLWLRLLIAKRHMFQVNSRLVSAQITVVVLLDLRRVVANACIAMMPERFLIQHFDLRTTPHPNRADLAVAISQNGISIVIQLSAFISAAMSWRRHIFYDRGPRRLRHSFPILLFTLATTAFASVLVMAFPRLLGAIQEEFIAPVLAVVARLILRPHSFEWLYFRIDLVKFMNSNGNHESLIY